MQGALQWLEDNQDKSIDDIKAAAATAAANKDEDEDEDETKAKIAELESGTAHSLVCNDCGKRFRNQDLASYHASKTSVFHPVSPSSPGIVLIWNFSDHTDFSESTEEIAPLTADEKKAKLDELRERLQAKRARQSEQDKEEQKRNEVRATYQSYETAPN